jgi:Xaa-Pro aminopeptidase
MFEALERLPVSEMLGRQEAVREHLAQVAPEAGGLAVFSRMGVYYLTGTWGNGVLWLPMSGEAVFLCRKGLERARLESPLASMLPFKSYSELPGLLSEAGSPLSAVVAAEMNGLTWALADLLRARVKDVRFVPGDAALAKAMSVKSEWELAKMRLCGARHDKALCGLLPAMLKPGMTEREAAHKAWEAFFSLGHMGHMRMNAHGEEIFLGHVAAGDSGNYPSVFNGPVGLRGEHPALALMGSAGHVWRLGEPLTMDIGFVLEGYHTDKTQVYWAGPASGVPDAVRKAHDFCIEVQTRVAEALRPGAVPSQLYAMALDMSRKAGMQEGFMGLSGNKVHFLGHGIGLAIDGWPVIAKGFDEPLREGMTLALEPKHGIPGVGMAGVENTFEVTAAGGVCLTGTRYDMLYVE